MTSAYQVNIMQGASAAIERVADHLRLIGEIKGEGREEVLVQALETVAQWMGVPTSAIASEIAHEAEVR